MTGDCCEQRVRPPGCSALPHLLVAVLALLAGLVAGTSAAAASAAGQPQASRTSGAEATSRVAPPLALAGAPAVVAGSSGSATVAGPVAGGGGGTALDAIMTTGTDPALAFGAGRADKTPRAGSAVLGGAVSRAPPRTAGT